MADTNNINIEDIMNEIRQKIKDQNLSSDMLSFEDVPYNKHSSANSANELSLNNADTALAYLNAHSCIQPYKELHGNPLFVFIKKVIRKLTKFYVEPVVFEQNDFNANTVHVLNVLKSSADTISTEDKNNIDELLERIEILELNQKNLSTQIKTLEKENRELKEILGKQAD